MQKRTNGWLASGLAAWAFTGSMASQADVVEIDPVIDAYLEFRDPTGVVAPDEDIAVWVTLSLSGDSAPLVYDSSAQFYGFPESAIPTTGAGSIDGDYQYDVPFAQYDYAYLFTSRSCSGTFTEGCSGGEYAVDTGPSASNWFGITEPYVLNPGESQDFLLYTLSPSTGSAAPGTYELFSVGLGIGVSGQDSEGNRIDADLFRAWTCSTADPACSFSRTVVAPVPVPAAVWLLGSALIGVGGFHRGRRTQRR